MTANWTRFLYQPKSLHGGCGPPLTQKLDISWARGHGDILDDERLDDVFGMRFQSFIKITRLLVDAGADLDFLGDTIGEPLKDVLDRVSLSLAN